MASEKRKCACCGASRLPLKTCGALAEEHDEIKAAPGCKGMKVRWLCWETEAVVVHATERPDAPILKAICRIGNEILDCLDHVLLKALPEPSLILP